MGSRLSSFGRPKFIPGPPFYPRLDTISGDILRYISKFLCYHDVVLCRLVCRQWEAAMSISQQFFHSFDFQKYYLFSVFRFHSSRQRYPALEGSNLPNSACSNK